MTMKKIIVFTMLFCGVFSAFSQTDSLFLKNYEEKILENSKLKNDLHTVKKNLSDLSDAYKKDTLALQKQIKDLRDEVSSEKQKVSDLNKNKIKEERDNLQRKVDSLNTVVSIQNQTIADREKQITKEKADAKTIANNAKNDGKAEALVSIVNSYKSRLFDDLIESSTKESVARDMNLVSNYPEVNSVLNDLQIYFNALELLSEKYDAVQTKNAQIQLSHIKRESKLLFTLKNDVDFYQDFTSAFKETIVKIITLDNHKWVDGDAGIQKSKFNDIVTILADYMYNYYDYNNYPYLSDLVLEIIKRKKLNADADISDLLKKLE